MNDNQHHPTRRRFLALSLSSLVSLGLLPRFSYAANIRELQGIVQVNGLRATMATIIKVGDSISTGPQGRIVFTIGQSVYQLDERSWLKLDGNTEKSAVHLVTGTMLAAFEKGEKKIRTPTSSIGIRGTALFLRVETDRTYFCTCYGETEIVTHTEQHKRIQSIHHDAYVLSHSDGTIVPDRDKITMNYHQDDDLFRLESWVGRQPPSGFKNNSSSAYY